MFMRTGSGLCSRKAFLEHLAVSHSFDKCVDSLSVCFKHWVKLWRYNRVNRSIPAAKSSRSTRKDRLKAQQMRISAQNVSTIYKTGKQQGFTVYNKYPEIYCVPQIMEKNVKNFLRIHTHTHTHIVAVILLLSRVFCYSMGCSLPGFSVQGISQAKILEWLAISFSRTSSLPRDWARIFCLAGRFFSIEPLGKPHVYIYIYNHFAVHLKLIQYCKSNILQSNYFLKVRLQEIAKIFIVCKPSEGSVQASVVSGWQLIQSWTLPGSVS